MWVVNSCLFPFSVLSLIYAFPSGLSECSVSKRGSKSVSDWAVSGDFLRIWNGNVAVLGEGVFMGLARKP